MIKEVLFLGAALLLAQTAQATVISHEGTIDGNFIDAAPSGAIGVDLFSLSFEWTNLTSPDSASIYFSADDSFDLFLTGYTDQGAAEVVSAFTLDLLNSPGGTVSSRIAATTDNCSILGLDCFPVTNTTATSGANGLVDIAFRPDVTNPILGGLAAGSYLFTFGESAAPDSGLANFELRTASVPTPAMLPLFALGILGMTLARRFRRS